MGKHMFTLVALIFLLCFVMGKEQLEDIPDSFYPSKELKTLVEGMKRVQTVSRQSNPRFAQLKHKTKRAKHKAKRRRDVTRAPSPEVSAYSMQTTIPEEFRYKFSQQQSKDLHQSLAQMANGVQTAVSAPFSGPGTPMGSSIPIYSNPAIPPPPPAANQAPYPPVFQGVYPSPIGSGAMSQ